MFLAKYQFSRFTALTPAARRPLSSTERAARPAGSRRRALLFDLHTVVFEDHAVIVVSLRMADFAQE
jgi:hypothetical protein